MDVLRRNNVQVSGSGPATMVFGHGFGSDLKMWRRIAPGYADRFRVVLFDHVGCGHSDIGAYDRDKYATLQGYADDLLEVIEATASGPVLFVGHSVSAMIGLLADLRSPGRFAAHLMVGPSPAYIDDADYHGGFSCSDIEGLLETLDANFQGWARTMAPVIMGSPGQPELGVELAASFCSADPEIATQFARVTFLSDHRQQLRQLMTQTLILQCSDDVLAPREVGHYMHAQIPNSTLIVIDNVGHFPHLSAPVETRRAMDKFLATLPF